MELLTCHNEKFQNREQFTPVQVDVFNFWFKKCNVECSENLDGNFENEKSHVVFNSMHSKML